MRTRKIIQENPMPYIDLRVFKEKAEKLLIKLNNGFVDL